MTQEVNDTMIKSTVPADDPDFMDAVVTRAEIETLVTDYFEQLRGILAVWFYGGIAGSPGHELYMWRRIDDFIKAGGISEEKVIELRDKFLGEFGSPEADEKRWQQWQQIQRELEEHRARLSKEGSTCLTVHSPGSNPIVYVSLGRKRSRDPHSQQVEGE